MLGLQLLGRARDSVHTMPMNRKLLFALLAVLVGYVGTYVWEANCVAAKVAEKFIETSPVVATNFGNVKHVRLANIGRLTEQGDAGGASFQFRVAGIKQDGNVNVSLVEVDGVWRVSSAAMSNVAIPVN